MRRASFEDEAVDYAAVGATQARDLMQYPPDGYTPSQDEFRLGSGDERFALASAALLTWGLQRACGIEVTDVHPGTGVQYGGIAFDADGTAVEPIEAHAEQRFAEDGTPFITAGTTVTLSGTANGEPVNGPHRVIYVVEEPTYVSLALGTMEGDPESGEQAFTIEQREGRQRVDHGPLVLHPDGDEVQARRRPREAPPQAAELRLPARAAAVARRLSRRPRAWSTAHRRPGTGRRSASRARGRRC